MKVPKGMRGIEPIIAVVILVAVTLVISIGVVGWIMGWWGTMGTTESIRIMPDSNITLTQNVATLYLSVKNDGSAAAVIYRVEIVGVKTFDLKPDDVITVGPGKTVTEDINLGDYNIDAGQLTAGATYLIRVYTRAGSVTSAPVQAKIG